MGNLTRDELNFMDADRAKLLLEIGERNIDIGKLFIINGAHTAGFKAGLEYAVAENSRLRRALERIGAGNPPPPGGKWLTDSEMAMIARNELAGDRREE